MPIKDFECIECFHMHTDIVSINTYTKNCSKCGKLAKHVLEYSPAFKGGSGFYSKEMSIPKKKDE